LSAYEILEPGSRLVYSCISMENKKGKNLLQSKEVLVGPIDLLRRFLSAYGILEPGSRLVYSYLSMEKKRQEASIVKRSTC